MKPSFLFFFERAVFMLLVTAFSVVNLVTNTLIQLTVAALILAALWMIIMVNSAALVKFYAKLVSFRANLAHYLTLGLLLIIVTAYMRGAFAGTIALLKAGQMSFIWVSLFVAAASVFAKYKTNVRKTKMVESILLSLNIYVLLNILLFLIGLPSLSTAYAGLSTGKATILGLLGVSSNRIVFPLALGVNGFGIISGAAFLIAFSLYKQAKKEKILYLVFMLSAAFGMLAVDSRGAILFTVMVLGFQFITPLKWLKHWRIAVLLAPLLPSAVITVSTIINSSFAFLNISRGETVLSFREVIWENVISFLQKDGFFNALFGYGYLGQVTSGAYEVYYFLLFSHLNVANPERASVHNFMLQNVLDFGLLGVLFILLLVFFTMTLAGILREQKHLYKAIMGFCLYLLLAGTTDLTLNVYNFHLFMPFLMLAVFFAFEQPAGLLKSLKQANSNQRGAMLKLRNEVTYESL